MPAAAMPLCSDLPYRCPVKAAGTTMADALVHTQIWWHSWAWGVPLLLCTVVFHLFTLHIFDTHIITHIAPHSQPRMRQRVWAMALIVFILTMLHAVEAAAWALAYVTIGALPDYHTAMLYSLGALTSYGHAPIFLARHWQMLGAIESLNGMMLLGVTTAFLLRALWTVWPRRQSPMAG